MTTKLNMHSWVCYVPIHADVIRNEDDEFLFKFHFEEDEINMDQLVVTSWDPDNTWCCKCGEPLKEVFGEACTVFRDHP